MTQDDGPVIASDPGVGVLNWSYEYISVTARGASPSTFGSVSAAGGLKSGCGQVQRVRAGVRLA